MDLDGLVCPPTLEYGGDQFVPYRPTSPEPLPGPFVVGIGAGYYYGWQTVQLATQSGKDWILWFFFSGPEAQ
jgi:hypothetical protein